jgi:mannose-1-phosphate guanylyltransferase
MKALLLAAGFGSRLGNITKEIPKPLVKVGDSAILEFCLTQLSQSGVTEVVINSHYLAEQIESFIEGFTTPLKVRVSFEEILLGTAGTLRKHFDELSTNDFIVMHADNYFAAPMAKFATEHKKRKVGKFGTLGTFETQSPENCGVVILNQDKTIKEFHEKVAVPPSNIANAAIYFFTPDIRQPLFELSQQENDISKHLIPKIMNGLFTHNFDGLFVDIGTPEGLKLANDYAAELRRSKTI